MKFASNLLVRHRLSTPEAPRTALFRVVVACLGTSIAAHAQQRYDIVQIPGYEARHINNVGTIASSAGIYDPRTNTIRTIPFHPTALNDRNQFVGTKFDDFYLYELGGTLTKIERLYPWIPAGIAWGINNAGRVVGSMSSGGEAFSWTKQGGMVSLTPGAYAFLRAINDLDQGIGQRNQVWQYYDGQFHALSFEPHAIAAAGLVVGRSANNDALILYRHGQGTQTIRTPNATDTQYYPNSVNEAGTIVGEWVYQSGSAFRSGGFLASRSLGYLEGAALDALVTPGWHIEALHDINEKGQIVGAATSKFSTTFRAVRLDPVGFSQAEAIPFGEGCYERFASFAELSNYFDLQDTTLRMTPTSGGYVVARAQGAWFPPKSISLAQSQPSVTNVIALPFAFRYPGGTTTSIRICSQGYIWLDAETTTIDRRPKIETLVYESPRLSPMWSDFYWGNQQNGTFHYDADAPNGVAYVTWDNIATGTGPVDVQCALYASGVVEYRYRRAPTWFGWLQNALVGFSPGNGDVVPPAIDISASLPFRTHPTMLRLTSSASKTPVLGETLEIAVTGIPANQSAGLLWLGTAANRGGIDLGGIGMPDCKLYTRLDWFGAWQNQKGTGRWSIPIPNSTALAGARLYEQAAVLDASANQAGVRTSNGLELRLGR
ncbi:MAG: hypothetical protein KDC95_19070 [Planctomycetes bacterium]|nr:hypothetical protein [Planctomycetota bacterium]